MSKLELENAIQNSLMILKEWKHHEEILAAINKAINLFEVTNPTFENAVILSINHSGDTDSTGSTTGNIIGLSTGRIGIPEDWILKLEMAVTIIQIAQNLHLCNSTKI